MKKSNELNNIQSQLVYKIMGKMLLVSQEILNQYICKAINFMYLIR